MPTGHHVRQALQRAVEAHQAAHRDTVEAAGVTSVYGGVGTGATSEEDLDVEGDEDGD